MEIVKVKEQENHNFKTKQIDGLNPPYDEPCLFSKYDTYLRVVSKEEYMNRILVDNMGASPIECIYENDHTKHKCSNELLLDQGYRVYYVDIEKHTKNSTDKYQQPLVIFVTIYCIIAFTSNSILLSEFILYNIKIFLFQFINKMFSTCFPSLTTINTCYKNSHRFISGTCLL
jgi:hypothetical protein